MAHRTREVRSYMESEGFSLLRHNKHLIWQHPQLGKITTPASFSDGARAIKNIASLIKRKKKGLDDGGAIW